MIGINNTMLFYLIVALILINMVFSINHVNTLVLFFSSTLVYYIYCYSINCNWVSLVILLWYARRISVLFYLLACYSSSLTYSNIYRYNSHRFSVKNNKFTLSSQMLMSGLTLKIPLKI